MGEENQADVEDFRLIHAGCKIYLELNSEKRMPLLNVAPNSKNSSENAENVPHLLILFTYFYTLKNYL